MKRNSFIFYKEYKDAIEYINDKEKRLQFYEMITEYAFCGKILDNVSKEIKSLFILIKDKIDKNNKSYWNYEDRRSSKYKKWKEEVLKRDFYTCRMCGSNIDLVVHHIQSFSKNKNLRYNIDNGIVLCGSCHKKVHKHE